MKRDEIRMRCLEAAINCSKCNSPLDPDYVIEIADKLYEFIVQDRAQSEIEQHYGCER